MVIFPKINDHLNSNDPFLVSRAKEYLSENRFTDIFSFLYVCEKYDMENLDYEERGDLTSDVDSFFLPQNKD